MQCEQPMNDLKVEECDATGASLLYCCLVHNKKIMHYLLVAFQA